MAIATGSEMPSTSGLPINIENDINALGGPLDWAMIQPGTQKKVEKIIRRLKNSTQK